MVVILFLFYGWLLVPYLLVTAELLFPQILLSTIVTTSLIRVWSEWDSLYLIPTEKYCSKLILRVHKVVVIFIGHVLGTVYLKF